MYERTFAIVEDGRVVNCALAVAPLFDNWIESDTAAIGDLYDEGAGIFSKPVVPVTRDGLIAAVTALRWEKMTGGVTLPDGTEIATTIEDQNRITSVVANAELAGLTDDDLVDFKAANGWRIISIGQVKAIAGAIGQFVQALYSAERSHHEAIEALSDSELASYDINEGW